MRPKIPCQRSPADCLRAKGRLWLLTVTPLSLNLSGRFASHWEHCNLSLQLLALFTENQIDDSALPTIEPRDLIELGVAPMLVLAILGPASAANKSKKLEAEDMLHDVATHQSVLEAELAEHRAEIEKLRIGRGELPDDYYCSITCDVMKDPVMAADGYTYERVAIEQWLATGAGTSPKTNELLENEKLLPNKALKALIVGELERRARARLG